MLHSPILLLFLVLGSPVHPCSFILSRLSLSLTLFLPLRSLMSPTSLTLHYFPSCSFFSLTAFPAITSTFSTLTLLLPTSPSHLISSHLTFPTPSLPQLLTSSHTSLPFLPLILPTPHLFLPLFSPSTPRTLLAHNPYTLSYPLCAPHTYIHPSSISPPPSPPHFFAPPLTTSSHHLLSSPPSHHPSFPTPHTSYSPFLIRFFLSLSHLSLHLSYIPHILMPLPPPSLPSIIPHLPTHLIVVQHPLLLSLLHIYPRIPHTPHLIFLSPLHLILIPRPHPISSHPSTSTFHTHSFFPRRAAHLSWSTFPWSSG